MSVTEEKPSFWERGLSPRLTVQGSFCFPLIVLFQQVPEQQDGQVKSHCLCHLSQKGGTGIEVKNSTTHRLILSNTTRLKWNRFLATLLPITPSSLIPSLTCHAPLDSFTQPNKEALLPASFSPSMTQLDIYRRKFKGDTGTCQWEGYSEKGHSSSADRRVTEGCSSITKDQPRGSKCQKLTVSLCHESKQQSSGSLKNLKLRHLESICKPALCLRTRPFLCDWFNDQVSGSYAWPRLSTQKSYRSDGAREIFTPTTVKPNQGSRHPSCGCPPVGHVLSLHRRP